MSCSKRHSHGARAQDFDTEGGILSGLNLGPQLFWYADLYSACTAVHLLSSGLRSSLAVTFTLFNPTKKGSVCLAIRTKGSFKPSTNQVTTISRPDGVDEDGQH